MSVISCPSHYQARVTITMAGGNVVRQAIYEPPVRHVRRQFQPRWRSQVRWTWGQDYRNQTGFWELTCPVTLQTFVRSGRRYINATDADGVFRSGQYLDSQGRSQPNYWLDERPGQPILLGYVTPPPPVIHYLDLYSNDEGGGGNFEQTWSQSGDMPDIKVDCSCDKNTQVQCGDMRANPAEDDWCCISCSSLNSTFNGWANQIENAKNRLPIL